MSGSSPVPIETHYDGYRFRSRLEARWAVFFNALGVRYEYEKDPYNLDPFGCYLPDFWLPDRKVWVETKGVAPTVDERLKARALASATHSDVFILYGFPYSYPLINFPGFQDCGYPDGAQLWFCDGIWYRTGKCGIRHVKYYINEDKPEWMRFVLKCDYWDTHPVIDPEIVLVKGTVLLTYELFRDYGTHATEGVFKNAVKRMKSARFDHGETPGI